MELTKKIHTVYADLTKSQKKIADFIGTDGIDVSFDSISALAKKVGVSEPSILRFARQMGYEGYPEFRKELQQELRNRLSITARLRRAVVTPNDHLLDSLLQQDSALIEQTRSAVSRKEFSKAIELISKSKKIFVIGFRSAFAVAYFLYFRLVRLGFDCRLLTMTGGTSLIEQLPILGEKDLLIATGFDNTPRETRIAMKYAHKRRVPILSITHSSTSEITRMADIYLIAQRRVNVSQSLAAPMALANALAIGVAKRKKTTALKALRHLDAIQQEYLDEK